MSLFPQAFDDLNKAEQLNKLIEKIDSAVYRLRAKVKKALGNIDGAIEDITYYCELDYYGNPATTYDYINKLLNDDL